MFRETRHNAWTFVTQDGRLYIRGTGQPFLPLTPSGPDAFNYGTRARAVFEREGGKVKAVRWLVRGGVRPGHLNGEPVPAAATLPQEQLRAYVGRYHAPKFDFIVTAANGQLAVQLTGQDPFLVYPVAGQQDRFAWDTVKAEVQFERFANGEVRGLVLHQNGRVRAERMD